MTDAPGTEYAAMVPGGAGDDSEALRSLAGFLGVSVRAVVEMRDGNRLGAAISRRQLEQAREETRKRLAGERTAALNT